MTIVAHPRKRYLGAEQRRALVMLASDPHRGPESLMLAHGFTRRMLSVLINSGRAVSYASKSQRPNN
jgi:hypothetical protein